MKRKTSLSLSDETMESIRVLAKNEDRSVSYVLEQFVNACAKVAEDATAYGKSIKEIADSIKNNAANADRKKGR